MSSSNGPDRTPKAQEVMDYLATHELTQRLNDIVNNTVRVRADDPFAYMAQQFLAIARPPAISHVAISTVLDSTGHFTSLQADVFAWQPSTLVHMGRSIWQGAQECDNVDQMSKLMTNQLKSKPLKCDSVSELDKILSDLNEPNSSTIIPAASLALARAVAHATRQDLYLFLHKQSNPEKLPNAVVPLPLIDIVKSTKLTFGYFGVFLCSKDLPLRQFFRSCSSIAKYVKEHIDAKDNANSVDMDKADALLNLLDGGIKSIEQTPGDPISLWFDANASHMHIPETGEYDIGGGASVSRDELLAQYQTMLEQHKSLSIIIDPFHSSDLQGWERFAQVMGNRCVAISSGESVHGSPSSISFESTVSNYLATAGTLRSAGKDFVFSANNSQCDDALADLAVAVSAKYCRFGLMANGYKSSLYNRLMQIEETIKAKD